MPDGIMPDQVGVGFVLATNEGGPVLQAKPMTEIVREAIRKAGIGAVTLDQIAAEAAGPVLQAVFNQLLAGGTVDWDAVAGPDPAPGFYWAVYGAETRPEVVEVEVGGRFVFSAGREGEYDRGSWRFLSPRLHPPGATLADEAAASDSSPPTGPSAPPPG